MGRIEVLDDGVYQLHYDFFDFNVGVLGGSESVLVIDSRASHCQALEMREDVRRLTPMRIDWMLNSHYHWDHTWGNFEFRDGQLWGHDPIDVVAVRTRLSAIRVVDLPLGEYVP
jgi:glyoxylase-like metal-dependent hydrolase (beta-lactamase superfamily II)